MNLIKKALASVALAAALVAPASAEGVLSNHLDVFATAPVSGSHNNLGVAAGIRLGKDQGVSVVPLVNFTAVNRKYYAEPGLALTEKVGKLDVGVAALAKQRSDLSLKRGYVPGVVFGYRF
jgi:hypothetical protein